MDTLKQFVRSKAFTRSLIALGIILATSAVFYAGLSVGYRKASFAYRWGETYHQNFGGPRAGFIPGIPSEDFVNQHGTFGRVLMVSMPRMIIESPEGLEKTVLISTGTTVMKFRDRVEASSIVPDDQAVVIGSPNTDAQIEARLIRILPAMPGAPVPQR